MKWGLVPHWTKSENLKLNTINARAESLIEGTSMWDKIKGTNRCLVLTQGYVDIWSFTSVRDETIALRRYYEWLQKGKQRLPHFTRRKDGKLMLLAGMYDKALLESAPGQSTELWTFTIVTTAANKEFEWLHDRQPVILTSQEAMNTWLDTSSQTWTPSLEQLLLPYSDPSASLEWYDLLPRTAHPHAEAKYHQLPR